MPARMRLASRARSCLGVLALLTPGLAVRAALAPYTAGSDLAQFAGFADTMLRHGLQFYSYSDASSAAAEGWPYPWPYVYGPLLAVILALLRLAAPAPVEAYWEGSTYRVLIPSDWAAAAKSVFIAFDTAAAVLLYRLAQALGATPGRARAYAALYYYNPMTIYVSSIYGMFDPIPLTIALAGLKAYTGGEKGLGLLLLGLAASTKPTMAVVAVPVLVHAVAGSRTPREAARLTGILLLGALGPFAPFALADPGGLLVFAKAVLSVAGAPYYSTVQYSFNGFASLAFYAWERGDEDVAEEVLRLWVVPFTTFYALLTWRAARHSLDPAAAASLAYTVFAATYWRVNPQYVTPLIAFLLLLTLKARGPGARLMAAVALVESSMWPLMYPVSFWAWVHIQEPNPMIVRALTSISLNVTEPLYYVYYSLALTVTLLILLVKELTHTTTTREEPSPTPGHASPQ